MENKFDNVLVYDALTKGKTGDAADKISELMTSDSPVIITESEKQTFSRMTLLLF